MIKFCKIKKTTIYLLIGLLLFSGCTKKNPSVTNNLNSNENDNKYSIVLNNSDVEDKLDVIIKENIYFAPYKQILKVLGVQDNEMTFYTDSKTLEIKRKDKYMFFVAGSPGIIIDNVMENFINPPMYNNNTLYIPVIFTAEKLGFAASFDESKKSLNISNQVN